MDIDEIINRASKLIERAEFEHLFREVEGHPDCLEILRRIVAIGAEASDENILTFANIGIELWRKNSIRKSLRISEVIAKTTTTSASGDTIGAFQRFGTQDDVDFLRALALDSRYTWYERSDENQQFFRKCVNAIGAISSRSIRSRPAIDALQELAEVGPNTAAYWAKRRLNKLLGERSAYHDVDLAVQPRPDYSGQGTQKRMS